MPFVEQQVMFRESQSDKLWVSKLSLEQARELNNWIMAIFNENIDLEVMPRFVSGKKLVRDFHDWMIYGAIAVYVKNCGNLTVDFKSRKN